MAMTFIAHTSYFELKPLSNSLNSCPIADAVSCASLILDM